MNIRRKANHDVVVENVTPLLVYTNKVTGVNRWQIVSERDGITHEYSDAVWEEIPTEKWAPAEVRMMSPRTMRVVTWGELFPGAVHRMLDFTLPDDMRFRYHPAGGICIERRIE